jgi:fructose-1,6-bisphosphatase/inositol monophosphatase family enzyme
MIDTRRFVPHLIKLHDQIRDAVVEACERASIEDLSTITSDEEGDTLYAVDRIGEKMLIDSFDREIARYGSLVLIAEGLPANGVVLPQGTDETDALWRVIVDPIDGTRGLMYQKRSAWILTGVAPNRGPATGLNEITLAVQTEIPLIKQHLSDSLWAIQGNGVQVERYNRATGSRSPISLKPSTANTIAHGFATISRFFPGARDELAAIDEEIVLGALGPVKRGKAHCFEDQYISTGGQLYELITGHDRFIADLRPLMEQLIKTRDLVPGICAHPYDLCTELIARELGAIITDVNGNNLSARLSLDEDVAWVGYANSAIRAQVEPLLQQALRKRGLL